MQPDLLRVWKTTPPTASSAEVAFVCFALLLWPRWLLWPRKRRYAKLALVALLLLPARRRYAKFALVALLASLLVSFNGCSGGQTAAPPQNPPSSSSFVLTVTASGGSGSQAVSHTVTLQVTVQ
jgi:O-antigen ligase